MLLLVHGRALRPERIDFLELGRIIGGRVPAEMATTALTFTALRPFGRGMQRRSAYALLRDEPAFVDTTFDFWAERLDRLRTFVDVSGLLQTDVVRHFLMFAVGITASDADMIVYHFEEPGSDVVAAAHS